MHVMKVYIRVGAKKKVYFVIVYAPFRSVYLVLYTIIYNIYTVFLIKLLNQGMFINVQYTVKKLCIEIFVKLRLNVKLQINKNFNHLVN